MMSQASINSQKSSLDAHLKTSKLRDMAGDSCMTYSTKLRMRYYSGNKLGSMQYLSIRKKELVALICRKIIATVWFTLS